MNKKLLIVICLIIVTCNLGIKAAFAAQATPSATPTTASDIEKSLQDRIKKALQENLGSVEQNIQQQTSLSSVRAFVGTIASVSSKAITIQTVNGIKQAEISDTTTLTSDGKSGVKITDLPVGNSIIAIGKSADNQTQASIKIIVSDPPTTDVRTVDVATISDTDLKTKTINLTSDKISTKPIKLSTRIQLFDSILNKITLDDINSGDKVFVIVHQLDTGLVLTRLINLSTVAPTPTPNVKAATTTKAVCGDKVCSSTESPETCPTDCQQ